ncbi:DNA-directed RNA polymerase subunit alpha C-terminal domain-containing protein [Longitalea arenae]|uniref:DNA-directed RNA polymerase subunit alpha C-terminal domain-containing protein n=1 Tax=Longitalea arenae TaxID=2812558 RepID=UPI0019680DC2|nr:DNA-directed RNA polymerase subunit alpha C-terminal domain-containing protein [Longitalea arenae]
MQQRDHDIARVQDILQHLDVSRCRQVAGWLQDHIRALEVDDAMFKLSIQQLRLSNRTLNVLQQNKIHSIGQLLKKASDWDNIRKLRGAGDKVLQEIRATVEQLQAGKIVK